MGVPSPTTADIVPLPLPVLVTVRTKDPFGLLTAELALEELLLKLGSALVAATMAALLIVCPPVPKLTVAVMVLVAEAPLAKLPIVQRLVEALKLPTVDVAETKVSKDGRVSEATTPVAASGPLFFTTKVKIKVLPALTVVLFTVLTMLTSALVSPSVGWL